VQFLTDSSGIIYPNADGSCGWLNGTNGSIHYAADSADDLAVWEYHEITFGGDAAQALCVVDASLPVSTKAAKMRLLLMANHNSVGTTDVEWDMTGATLSEMTGSTLIEDGAITTEKLTVGAVKADNIAANAVHAEKLIISGKTGSLTPDAEMYDQTAWEFSDDGLNWYLIDDPLCPAGISFWQAGAPSGVNNIRFDLTTGTEDRWIRQRFMIDLGGKDGDRNYLLRNWVRYLNGCSNYPNQNYFLHFKQFGDYELTVTTGATGFDTSLFASHKLFGWKMDFDQPVWTWTRDSFVVGNGTDYHLPNTAATGRLVMQVSDGTGDAGG